MALDADNKTFVVHVAIWEQKEIVIDSVRKAQIEAQSRAQSAAQVGALIFDKAPTKIPAEYSNYNNVFSAENVAELLENTGINEHVIKLKESKQPFFGLIYNLGLLELERLKTYIKTNLANDFIHSSKSPTGAPILFDKKLDKSFCFCIDYWGLNNITIKN